MARDKAGVQAKRESLALPRPGYIVGGIASLCLVASGIILSVMTKSDTGVPIIPPVWTTSMTTVGALIVGLIGSGYLADSRLQEQMDEKIKGLRRSVCGQAATINTTVRLSETLAEQVMRQVTDPASVAHMLRVIKFGRRVTL